MACGGRDYHASCPWSNGFHCRLRFYTRTSPRAQGRNRILCSTRTQRAIFYYIGFNVNSAMQMVDNSKSYVHVRVRTYKATLCRRVLVQLLYHGCCTGIVVRVPTCTSAQLTAVLAGTGDQVPLSGA